MLTALVQCNYHLVVPTQVTTISVRTDNHSPTRHYPTMHYLLLSRFSWELTVLLEGGRTSHYGSKHSLSLAVCLNHMVIHRYLISTELYLNFSNYDDKLLVMKSLVNILKYACWCITAYGNRIKVSKISQT